MKLEIMDNKLCCVFVCFGLLCFVLLLLQKKYILINVYKVFWSDLDSVMMVPQAEMKTLKYKNDFMKSKILVLK